MASSPIDWPTGLVLAPLVGWPRAMRPADARRRSQFSASLGDTVSLLRTELRELGASRHGDAVLQLALAPGDFRRDGMPRAGARPEHPGVVLGVSSRHGPLSYPCDTFLTWQDNLRAIALSLRALRQVDRYGVTVAAEQYRGFAALPGPGDTSPVVAVTTATMSAARAREVIMDWAARAHGHPVTDRSLADCYRLARRGAHPDTGTGSREAWDLVLAAGEALGL